MFGCERIFEGQISSREEDRPSGSAPALLSADVQLAGHILPLIGRYGYPAVFLGVMDESTGVPLPGEVVVLALAPRRAYRRAMRPGLGEDAASDAAGKRRG